MKYEKLYALINANSDELDFTEFKMIHPVSDYGSLLLNLTLEKDRYKFYLNEDESTNNYERLIYTGKIKAINTIIDCSSLYQDYFERKEFDYGKIITCAFPFIRSLFLEADRNLKLNQKYDALINIVASKEIDMLTTIIHKNYWGVKKYG